MKKGIAKLIVVFLIVVALNIQSVYAAGATASLSKTEAQPGDTVELNIALSTASIGYQINIKPSDSTLIESSELVSKIGEGTASQIKLIQIAPETERTTYTSGTNIAKIKYKISSAAKDGDKININVTGSVAGRSSEEENEVNESITIHVVASEQQEQNKTPQEEQKTDPKKQETEKNTKQSTNQNTKREGTLPKAGVEETYFFAFAGIVLLIALVVSYRRYCK